MAYPGAYLNDEKKFLTDIAARVPSLRAHFERCANIYPPDRPQQLAKLAAVTVPSLWGALGVPEDRRPSYAAIGGLMAHIAFNHVHDDHDFTIVMQLVRAAHVSDTITGDLTGYGLSADEIAHTQDLAMRMMNDNIECRALRDTWEDACDGTLAESQWTRDLHRIALALLAEERRVVVSDEAKLDETLGALRAALETEHGGAVMNSLLRRAPSPG